MKGIVLAKSKRSRRISYILRLIIAAGALYLAFRGEDLRQVFGLLLEINGLVLAAAVGAWLANQLLFVARWTLLLKVQSINIGYWAAFRLHLLGIFYNNCLPSAVGGDLLRAWYVTSHTNRKLEAALSVFVDRVVGITGMVIMAAMCYWVIPVEGKQTTGGLSYEFDIAGRIWGLRWFLMYVAAGIIGILVLLLVYGRTRAILRRAYVGFRRWMTEFWQRVHSSIAVYCRHWFAMLVAFLLTFACQSVLIVGMWLVGREIGIDSPAKYYFVFFPVAWILGALPISVAGLGIWEGTLKIMFGTVSAISSEHLAALALAHRALWLFGSLPGVVIHLFGAHLPKEFSVDCKEIVK